MKKQRKRLEKLLTIVLSILLSGSLQLSVVVAAETALKPGDKEVELTSKVTYTSGTQFNLQQGESINFNINISVPDGSLKNITDRRDANIASIDTLYSVNVNEGGITVGTSGNKGSNIRFFKDNTSFDIPVTATVSQNAKPGIYEIPIKSYITNGSNQDKIVDKTIDYVKINVVNIAPTLVLTEVPNAWTNNGSVNFAWSGSDYDTPSADLQYSWKLNDGSWSTYAKVNTISFTGLEDGKYTFTVKAKDFIGSESTPAQYKFGVDTGKPVVTASPDRTANAKGWYNNSVTVSFNATDDLSGVAQTDQPITLSSEGANQQIDGHAADNAGNIGTGGTSVSIDKTAPTVTFENLQDGDVYEVNENVAVIWNASDLISGIESATGTLPSGSLIDTGSIGTKEFSVTAIDNAGNSISKTVTYRVQDTTPPDMLITLEPSVWSSTDTLKFSWSGSDNYTQSSALQYSWQLDDGSWSAYEAEYTTTLTGLNNGNHTFKVKAKDSIGNESASLECTFGVDTEKPVVNIQGVQEGATYEVGQNIPVTWTVEDALSGIDSAVGTVPSGSVVDTSSAGAKQFLVTAADKAGNSLTKTVNYNVITPVVKGPSLNVSSPTDNLETSSTFVTILAEAEAGSTVKIDGLIVYRNSMGNIVRDYNLMPGTNIITITAADVAGNTTTVTRTVKRPVVMVNTPTNNLQTNKGSINVSGLSVAGAVVKVNGQVATLDSQANFNVPVNLQEGNNVITVVGTDKKGYTTSTTLNVVYDTIAPTLTVSSPAGDFETTNLSTNIFAQAEPGSTVKINGLVVYRDSNGNIVRNYNLTPGTNTITITATDVAGNTTTVTRTVKRPVAIVNSPTNNLQTNSGTINVSGISVAGAVVKVNGQLAALDSQAHFNVPVNLQDGNNVITVEGTDNKGYTTRTILNVEYDTLAPTLTVSSPAENIETTKLSVTISVQAESGSTVRINGLVVYRDSSGNIIRDYSLTPGTNTFTITATDAAGNTTTVTRTVTRL